MTSSANDEKSPLDSNSCLEIRHYLHSYQTCHLKYALSTIVRAPQRWQVSVYLSSFVIGAASHDHAHRMFLALSKI